MLTQKQRDVYENSLGTKCPFCYQQYRLNSEFIEVINNEEKYRITCDYCKHSFWDYMFLGKHE